MSDHEVETFESTDAGASKTVPMQAGSVRKGGYIVIKGKACKVRASSIIFSRICVEN
jgi:translation initiation factor 5A